MVSFRMFIILVVFWVNQIWILIQTLSLVCSQTLKMWISHAALPARGFDLQLRTHTESEKFFEFRSSSAHILFKGSSEKTIKVSRTHSRTNVLASADCFYERQLTATLSVITISMSQEWRFTVRKLNLKYSQTGNHCHIQ